MSKELQLLRAALVALYGIQSGDVSELDADKVMFTIEEWLDEHDPEWLDEWHAEAVAGEESEASRRVFARRCRSWLSAVSLRQPIM